jgi:hypothetical protein
MRYIKNVVIIGNLGQEDICLDLCDHCLFPANADASAFVKTLNATRWNRLYYITCQCSFSAHRVGGDKLHYQSVIIA